MFQTDIILEKIRSPNGFSHRIKKKYEEGQLVEG